MSEEKARLLKRLHHNAAKIKEPTIKQLLQDAADYLSETPVTVADLAKNESQLQARLEEALKAQISFVDVDEYPTFEQGAPSHELHELATAELCNNMVNALKRSNARLDSVDNGIKEAPIPENDRAAITNMMHMVVLMERAGFMGIMWEYMTAKSKFHDRITAQRVNGGIVAFDVKLQDDTVVTLRNPECVDPDSAVPTSVSAGATASTNQSDGG